MMVMMVMEGKIGRVARRSPRRCPVWMVRYPQIVVGPPADRIQRFLQPSY